MSWNKSSDYNNMHGATTTKIGVPESKQPARMTKIFKISRYFISMSQIRLKHGCMFRSA